MQRAVSMKHYRMPALLEQWLELCRCAAAMGGAGLYGLFALSDRQLRNLWLAELGRVLEQMMRSPAGLEFVRYNLRVMTRTTSLISALHFR